MKKILSILMVVALMAVCLFTFASCGSPNKDYKKAKKALEKADYTVNVQKSGDDVYLSAYSESGADFIQIGYFEDKDDAKKAYKELKSEVAEYQEELDEMIEDLEKEFKGASKKEREEIWEEFCQNKGLDPDEVTFEEFKKTKLVYGGSGTMVWLGTANAVNDAK